MKTQDGHLRLKIKKCGVQQENDNRKAKTKEEKKEQGKVENDEEEKAKI
jgi:hypothetical protein